MNKIALVRSSGTQAQTAYVLCQLAVEVAQDPAVQRVWRAAGEDCSNALASFSESGRLSVKAARSIAAAGRETQTSWRAGKSRSIHL